MKAPELTAEFQEERMRAKLASFKVGDEIIFHLYDETGCNEHTGDPVEIEMRGRILKIEGEHATVEHKYGICQAWLAISHKPSEAMPCPHCGKETIGTAGGQNCGHCGIALKATLCLSCRNYTLGTREGDSEYCTACGKCLSPAYTRVG